MDEFGLIHRYFAPLSGREALGLKDDAALLDMPAGETLVVTKDVISAGVHFIGDEPPELIARKLLRVNLSDLAAMGATPYAYLLGLAVPENTPEDWFADFACGLAQDQEAFGIHLAGGDTTATQGSLTLSLTALGRVKKGAALLRCGAHAGDGIYVSGTVGDAALGLRLLKKLSSRRRPGSIVPHLRHNKKDHTAPDGALVDPGLRRDDSSYLIQRYQLPEPRLALGQALPGIASAAIDISDGMAQDLGHICAASQCGAQIHTSLLPVSAEAKKTTPREECVEYALTGGDDYELLFTAPADAEETIRKYSETLAVPITRIGRIMEGTGVQIMDDDGKPYKLKQPGYRHF